MYVQYELVYLVGFFAHPFDPPPPRRRSITWLVGDVSYRAADGSDSSHQRWSGGGRDLPFIYWTYLLNFIYFFKLVFIVVRIFGAFDTG